MQDLPESVERFIRQQIDSVGQLEALLLLFRSGDHPWSASEIAQRLYVNEHAAQAMLDRLEERNLVRRVDDTFLFDHEDAARAQEIGALETLYRTHLIPISQLIHSKASTRIQEFADAFTFKRRK